MVLLLVTRQEVAKKRAKTFPLGTPLALPLFKAGFGERYIYFLCISRHIPTTSGRRGKQDLLKQIKFHGAKGVGAPELARADFAAGEISAKQRTDFPIPR
jgi:hypothetical protein